MVVGLGRIAFLYGVFHQGNDSTRHESCCPHYGATPGELGDLDQAGSYRGLYSTSGFGRHHLVSAGGISDIDDDLDSITLYRRPPAVCPPPRAASPPRIFA